MVAGGSVLTVVLLLVGAWVLALSLLAGQHARSGQVAVGLVLVGAGHLLRAADTLGWLPDVLAPGADDEDAVATLFGLAALLVGGLLVVQPTVGVTDLRRHWSFALPALFVLVLLVVHVVGTFTVED